MLIYISLHIKSSQNRKCSHNCFSGCLERARWEIPCGKGPEWAERWRTATLVRIPLSGEVAAHHHSRQIHRQRRPHNRPFSLLMWVKCSCFWPSIWRHPRLWNGSCWIDSNSPSVWFLSGFFLLEKLMGVFASYAHSHASYDHNARLYVKGQETLLETEGFPISHLVFPFFCKTFNIKVWESQLEENSYDRFAIINNNIRETAICLLDVGFWIFAGVPNWKTMIFCKVLCKSNNALFPLTN